MSAEQLDQVDDEARRDLREEAIVSAEQLDQVDDEVLDVAGAAALLKIGRDAIYAACARQQIPHRKIGKALRFSRTALVRWLDSCGQQGAQKEGQ